MCVCVCVCVCVCIVCVCVCIVCVCVCSFGLSAPGWACAWDDEEPVYCYCGLQNGSVEQFDVRMPSQRLHALLGGSDGVNGCPITAMTTINRDFNSRLKCVCVCVCACYVHFPALLPAYLGASGSKSKWLQCMCCCCCGDCCTVVEGYCWALLEDVCF